MKYLLSIILFAALLSFIPNSNQQPKEYGVHLSLSDWNILVESANNSDNVSVNSRKAVLQKLVDQINRQIQVEKQLTDSLSKLKSKKP